VLTKPQGEPFPSPPHGAGAASPWIRRFAPLIAGGGRVLDLAAGQGRHTRLLSTLGFDVVAVDRDIEGLRDLAADPRLEIRRLDLETGAPWALGGGFAGIVVTNYLHRPLFPAIEAALAVGGILIYETFAQGNERFGKPSNPEFLLAPGELLAAFVGLTPIAFEQGAVATPRPAVVQRLVAAKGVQPAQVTLPPATCKAD
jgi:SAM-dependent methyltransferase